MDSFDPWWYYYLGSIATSVGAYSLLALFYGFIVDYDLFPSYRIQGKKWMVPKLFDQTVQSSVNSLMGQPLTFLIVWPLVKDRLDFETSALQYGWKLIPCVLWCAVMVDTCMFWTHYPLHWKQFYKYHKIHHELRTPTVISLSHTHFVETFAFIICVLVPPLSYTYVFGKMPIGVWFAWLALRWWETAVEHSGYTLPIPPFCWMETAEKHDFHHSVNTGCYGSFFALWDRMLGTDKTFKEWKAKGGPEKARKLNASKNYMHTKAYIKTPLELKNFGKANKEE